MNIRVFTKKAVKKTKKSLKQIFCKKKILKEELSILQYKYDFLRAHADCHHLKPATGFLREYQLKELAFLKEISEFLSDYNINLILSGGGLLGLVRNGGFLPWDDDIDVDAIRSEYEKILEIARSQWTWVDITESCDSLYKYYDEAIQKNPDKIVAIHTPWSLHIYRGKNIKDAVNIEFFPLDYMKDEVTAEELVEYKTYIKGKIKALSKNGFGKLLDFYEKEKEKSKVFTKEETGHIYYGIGNYGLTEYSFHSLIEKSVYFPLKKAVFEGVEVNIPRESEKALSALFGAWESLPKDVGIAHTFEAINEYLRDNGQEEINYKEL